MFVYDIKLMLLRNYMRLPNLLFIHFVYLPLDGDGAVDMHTFGWKTKEIQHMNNSCGGA